MRLHSRTYYVSAFWLWFNHSKIVKTWELFQTWRSACATVRSMRLFQRLMKDKKSGMTQIVQNYALRMAISMHMSKLDSMRIMHCRFCDGTAPLHKHMDYFLCPRHYQAVVADEANKAKSNGVVKDAKEALKLVKPI